MTSAIEVRNLRKVFDGTPALDGVGLTVPKGAVFGLVGPNGCGKPTLISHLVHGSVGEVREALAALHPSYLEVLPLSLEERFICELGGDDDGIM